MKSPLPLIYSPDPPDITLLFLLLIISQKELSPVIQLQWAAALIAILDGTIWISHQNEAKHIDLRIMKLPKAFLLCLFMNFCIRINDMFLF